MKRYCIRPQDVDLAGRQPQKMRLRREPAEKNNRLSRRENCGIITEKFIVTVFNINYASYSPRPYSPSLVGVVMLSLCL